MIENKRTISNTGVFQLISVFKGWRLANVPFGATVCTGATLNGPQKAEKSSLRWLKENYSMLNVRV